MVACGYTPGVLWRLPFGLSELPSFNHLLSLGSMKELCVYSCVDSWSVWNYPVWICTITPVQPEGNETVTKITAIPEELSYDPTIVAWEVVASLSASWQEGQLLLKVKLRVLKENLKPLAPVASRSSKKMELSDLGGTAFTPLDREARPLFAAKCMEQECQNVSASELKWNAV